MHVVDPLDPMAATAFADWYAVLLAVSTHELADRAAPWSAHELTVRAEQATDRSFTLLAATVDRVTVGAAELVLPLTDNLHAAYAELRVLPEFRRRGVGSALLHALEHRAVLAGRSVLDVEYDRALDSPDATGPFARAHGYTEAQTLAHNDLDLEGPVRPLPCPPGYRLETWWDEIPEAWLDQQAVLSARMSTDAPNGDTALEPTVWDADRVRAQVALARAQGRTFVQTVAVDASTATLAAYTHLVVSAATPTVAYQHDTLVLREHRGHGLGVAIKSAAAAALVERLPQVRRISTWNAHENEPMLRINRALGYREVARLSVWEKRCLT